ncbi:MAG: NAD-dependent epimerase/dehydratase family protein [Terriglobia bacterium]|nr:NAD-dependent epimerase/dehydratase family protein [Terriglobia bacterium]
MAILVTGAAGFIGFHTSLALLSRGEQVIGIDNLNDYYDVNLKHARLAQLEAYKEFTFHKVDISDKETIFALFETLDNVTGIVHLAAQAGVRYSLVNPFAYIATNVMGHTVILEAARRLPHLAHMVYASSSSVYGSSIDFPFSLADRVDTPNSLYAATKRADELIGHTYAHLYKMKLTGLRFFTVYGPWGRPDMAAYIFATKIAAGEPISVFNKGEMWRDFTYIDDIVAGVIAALDHPPSGEVPHRVYNLGNHRCEKLTDFIAEIQKAMGAQAIIRYEPIQPGDVPKTYADISESQRDLRFEPKTPISEGIPRFITWFKQYHGI